VWAHARDNDLRFLVAEIAGGSKPLAIAMAGG
jgi:hypothetical protein